MLKYVLLLYVILVLINTNSIEKKMLYTLIKNGDFKNVSQHPVEYDIGIGKYLTAPLYFDRNRLTKVSYGELFNAYCFTKPYAKVQQELQSKLFWDEYLPRNGINVPKLYATTNPLRVYEDIDPEKEYISKPEYGTTGNGIKIVRGEEIRPTETNHLIQEKIGSCGYDGSRTFRVITTYDGEVLVIYEFKNDDKITSNTAKGGTSRIRTDVPEIVETVEKLRTLHVRDFDFCFSIGWDLMVDCDDVYVLEGNWPSGLYGKVNNNDEFIEKVKRKANRFYALNNI
jgi:hypothetical protein